MSDCATGLHPGGAVIAKTGEHPSDPKAGTSTGEHLNWSQLDAVTREYQPPQVGYLQWILTGQPPKTLKEIEAMAVPLAPMITCGVGHAEGTQDAECNLTAAFWGHVDPGNGVWNQGTFSYQHGAAGDGEVWSGLE